MDETHFDALTRSLIQDQSRRGLLATLLGGTLALFERAETLARKKGRKGKGKVK
jgi:hypothetical protein